MGCSAASRVLGTGDLKPKESPGGKMTEYVHGTWVIINYEYLSLSISISILKTYVHHHRHLQLTGGREGKGRSRTTPQIWFDHEISKKSSCTIINTTLEESYTYWLRLRLRLGRTVCMHLCLAYLLFGLPHLHLQPHPQPYDSSSFLLYESSAHKPGRGVWPRENEKANKCLFSVRSRVQLPRKPDYSKSWGH